MRIDEYYWHLSHLEEIQDLDSKRDEYILDLGCGDGKKSFVIEDSGATVLGIDINASSVKDAQNRGIDARVEDAQNMQFNCKFDAVFSSNALHYILRQDNIIERVFKALKPGGRFVATMGAKDNFLSIRQAVAVILEEHSIDFFKREPWIYPTSDEQCERLKKAGFNVIKCTLHTGEESVRAEYIREWFDTFWSFDKVLSDLSDSDRNKVISSMIEQLNSQFCNADEMWTVDYAQLKFVAIKPHDSRP